MEITTIEQNKEKRINAIEDSLRDFWDIIKHSNIQIIGGPRRRRGKEKD